MDKRLAVFDFDGTLIAGDSLIAFARHAAGTRRLILALLRSAGAIIRWKLGMSSGGAAKEILFGHIFGGMDYTRFKDLGEAFASEVTAMEREDVAERLRGFVRDGVPVAIVTASMPEWVLPWARRQGVATVIGTLPATDGNGRLTGRFATPNCRDAEKVRRLREVFPDLAEREVWAFGDSDGDIPLPECSTHPVWVKR